jgi:hypothetical protein
VARYEVASAKAWRRHEDVGQRGCKAWRLTPAQDGGKQSTSHYGRKIAPDPHFIGGWIGIGACLQVPMGGGSASARNRAPLAHPIHSQQTKLPWLNSVGWSKINNKKGIFYGRFRMARKFSVCPNDVQPCRTRARQQLVWSSGLATSSDTRRCILPSNFRQRLSKWAGSGISNASSVTSQPSYRLRNILRTLTEDLRAN